MNLAIFDIDGTITRRSSERFFIRYLLRRKTLTFRRLIATFFLFLIKHPLQAFNGFKQNKMYLRNLKEQDTRALAAECFDKYIQFDIKNKLVDEIRRRKSEGYKILLLSGSLPCLVEPMVRRVGADFMICSELELSDGKFTGNMTALHPYGRNKQILAELFCKENSFDLQKSCAYANEWADR
ncbi:HAD-IB family phosphatase, partial [bacterium]|nr:HAD-IB family phosphatase [bacterium]